MKIMRLSRRLSTTVAAFITALALCFAPVQAPPPAKAQMPNAQQVVEAVGSIISIISLVLGILTFLNNGKLPQNSSELENLSAGGSSGDSNASSTDSDGDGLTDFVENGSSNAPAPTPITPPQQRFAASGVPIVNQGDAFYIHDTGSYNYECTVGYVDKASGALWTAGHCARGRDGEPVYVATDRGEYKIGTIEIPYVSLFDSQEDIIDIAYIDIANKDMLGENIYSGDTIVDPDDVATIYKDKIQILSRMKSQVMTFPSNFSVSIGEKSTKVPEATAIRVGFANDVGLANMGNLSGENRIEDYGQQGDSGGPAFIEGVGFVGVISRNGQVYYTVNGVQLTRSFNSFTTLYPKFYKAW